MAVFPPWQKVLQDVCQLHKVAKLHKTAEELIHVEHSEDALKTAIREKQ